MASTPEKRARALALGAKATVDPASGVIREEIRAATPRGFVDVIVDPVGGPTFEALFRSLAKEGRHLVIGFAGGSIPALPTNLPLLKSAALVGVEIRYFLASRPGEARTVRESLFAQVASGALEAPLTVPFRLTQAGEALAATSSRYRIGKVVVLPDEGTD